MTAAYEGKLIANTKKDPAFLTKGFTYWKKAPDHHFQEARGQRMSHESK